MKKTVLIIILVLGLLGTSGYIIYEKTMKEDKTIECQSNKSKDDLDDENIDGENKNILTDEKALEIGNKLYETAHKIFDLGEEYKYDFEGYIESCDSSYMDCDNVKENTCSWGIGCIPITNWNEIKQYFSQALLDQLTDSQLGVAYNLQIINDKGYRIDGVQPNSELVDYELKIISKQEDEIRFKVELKYKTAELCESCNSNQILSSVTIFAIKMENNEWKIDRY